MIGVTDPGQAESDLAAGSLSCPSCTGPLQPWGHARARTVRDRGTTTVLLRPRRARCRSRRADTTAVIGSALQASARGTGYRRIAAQLQRPLSTVRRWIRAVRDPAHVEWLRTQGMVWLARVDLDVINTLAPQATRLGDALTTLAAAALTPPRQGRPARLTVDADRPDHPRPARRATGVGPAGLRFRSCLVLARPHLDATGTTSNRRVCDWLSAA